MTRRRPRRPLAAQPREEASHPISGCVASAARTAIDGVDFEFARANAQPRNPGCPIAIATAIPSKTPSSCSRGVYRALIRRWADRRPSASEWRRARARRRADRAKVLQGRSSTTALASAGDGCSLRSVKGRRQRIRAAIESPGPDVARARRACSRRVSVDRSWPCMSPVHETDRLKELRIWSPPCKNIHRMAFGHREHMRLHRTESIVKCW